jgi:serine/threonine protein kinase
MAPGSPCDEIDLLAVNLGETVSPEVQTHIDSCPVCQRRLDALRGEMHNLQRAARAMDSATRPEPVGPADRSPSLPGAIGKYYVVGILGGGGQGTVYRVLHPELNRELVIKVARLSCATDSAERDLLVREGRVLADLDHPGLAHVHDLGFHDGRPYLVMDYVRGVTLEQHVANRRLTPTQAASLVAQVAHALASAHRRGVVHQDIKPSNILIDEAGRPRVIDFGLARLRGAWTGEAPQPSGGTAAYMSPEQARDEEARVGPQSDVFALGGVLYFLLTGKPPFAGPSWSEARERAARCDFDRTALQAAGVPRRLRAVCLRAMAADPSARSADACELAADLERALARPRGLLLAGAAVLLALALLGAWWALQRSGPDSQPQAQDGRDPALKQEPFKGSSVERDGTLLTLDSALPLRTGDKLHLECAVPAGVQAALFWFDSEGKVHALTEAEVVRGVLEYPAWPALVPLTGPPGTELILVCGSRSGKPSREGVQGVLLFEDQKEGGGGPLPRLPDGVKAVLVSEQRVRVIALRDVGAPERGAAAPAVERLEAVRLGLVRRYEFVAGLAFAHR